MKGSGGKWQIRSFISGRTILRLRGGVTLPVYNCVVFVYVRTVSNWG